MTVCRIRIAEAGDSNVIQSISDALGYAEQPELDARTSLERLLVSPSDFVFVAEVEQQVVGWIHCFVARRLGSPDFYEIGGLAVTKSRRRQGVGAALIDFVVARFPGVWRVRCNDERTAAHRFYESAGFESVKNQRVFENRGTD